MFPKSPNFGSLRLATIQDVPRLAVVATSGFYYSPVFAWERRYHQIYPEDTLKSYKKMFADIIRDPECIAIVVEDSFQKHESEKTGAIIKPGLGYREPEHGDNVVVGAATWKLESGSNRRGQFMDQKDLDSHNGPIFNGGLGRDKSESHAKLLDDKCDAAEEEYFEGHSIMDMVVTHPAYWASWAWFQAGQGVIAANTGEKLYLTLGYKELSVVEVKDEEDPPNKVKVGILRYSPPSTPEHSLRH